MKGREARVLRSVKICRIWRTMWRTRPASAAHGSLGRARARVAATCCVPPWPRIFPFDEQLRKAFIDETQLLFASIVREDRSILDVLRADYTYLNQRLAEHYGVSNVYGSQLRRVPVSDLNRRGLLGHGSILALTSYPNRTSVVQRGKWVLENLLGAPPPAPPPDVPQLQVNRAKDLIAMSSSGLLPHTHHRIGATALVLRRCGP